MVQKVKYRQADLLKGEMKLKQGFHLLEISRDGKLETLSKILSV